MRTFVASPKAEGQYPGIWCYSDIFQLTRPLLRFCVRLATHQRALHSSASRTRTLVQSNLSDLLGPPCRPVAATAKDARQAEQIAEVVPGSVVVDLVDS